tara:strand:+ start:866 stop:1102 length:237 start_codon:yes stop_codon:yes gene_type:complete
MNNNFTETSFKNFLGCINLNEEEVGKEVLQIMRKSFIAGQLELALFIRGNKDSKKLVDVLNTVVDEGNLEFNTGHKEG